MLTAARRRSRVSNYAPIFFVHCPVHGQKVGTDGEGRLLGRCDGCMADCATALRRLKKMRSAA